MQKLGTTPLKRPAGMAGFTVVWAGQLISVLASSMSAFALSIWMFQKTGSATAMSLMVVSFMVPFMIVTPFSGVLVDRHNRKLMMMLSDMTAALGTVGILVFQSTGQLQFWHLYVANILFGLGNAFQWPAYSATISTMLPKELYSRANGMMSLIESGPGVFAPLLAGALMPYLGLTGILGIDVATFLLAIGALLVVHIPQPDLTVDGQAGKGTFFQEMVFGFKYIFARPSLLAYVAVVLGINTTSAFADFVLVAPLILSRSGQDTVVYGAVQTALAVGGVVGGLLMSAWAGFKRKTVTMVLGWAFFALIGNVFFGVARTPAAWIVICFVAALSFPVTSSAAQAIWQSKVAPDVQGRVFAARRTIALLTQPVMPLIAGLLADHVTEPFMRSQTSPADAARWLVGSGPGSGMSLQFVIGGVLYLAVLAVGWMIPAFRDMETLLPDHDQIEKVNPPSQENDRDSSPVEPESVQVPA